MAEENIWKGASSQTMHLGKYLLCLVAVVAAIVAGFLWQSWVLLAMALPVLFALYLWLRVRSTVYTLTSERFRVTQGILGKRTDDLELYRVKDLTLLEPLSQRMVRAGTIEMTTSDHTTPRVTLPAIREPGKVLDLIRTHVEKQRDRKRVTEVDMT
jgi:uncharacterized membrane protein YdbT with pleckstrin-like domain